jgi:hypothetical protein
LKTGEKFTASDRRRIWRKPLKKKARQVRAVISKFPKGPFFIKMKIPIIGSFPAPDLPEGFCFSLSHSSPTRGVSSGLAKGLSGLWNGNDITQEGMGLGSPALKIGKQTYFSRTCSIERDEPESVAKRFLIDTQFEWCFGNRPSSLLAHIMNGLVHSYMNWRPQEIQQAGLKAGTLLRRLLRIRNRLVYTRSLAQARFLYRPVAGGLEVTFSIRALRGFLPKICLLNELGADFLDAACDGQKSFLLPSGWQKLTLDLPSPSLGNRESGLRFFIRSFSSPSGIPVQLFWGREKTAYLCWAGFDFELDCTDSPTTEVQFAYTLAIEKEN